MTRAKMSGSGDQKPKEYQIEYPGLAKKSVANETVRANNKRIDRGEPLKKIPNYRAAGAKIWKKAKSTRKRTVKK